MFDQPLFALMLLYTNSIEDIRADGGVGDGGISERLLRAFLTVYVYLVYFRIY